jgi:mannan endo-1,4-beta-mannosidase
MLRSGIAGDQVWQFGPYGTSVDVAAFGDPNSIYVNDPEYEGLARQHAANMLAKPVHIIRQ